MAVVVTVGVLAIAVSLVMLVLVMEVVMLMPVLMVADAVATVVVKAMACAGAVSDKSVGVLVIDVVRADVLIDVVDTVATTLECDVSVLYFATI